MWILYCVGCSLCCLSRLDCISAPLVSLILMVFVSPISSLLLPSQPTVHHTHTTRKTELTCRLTRSHTNSRRHTRTWGQNCDRVIYNSQCAKSHWLLFTKHQKRNVLYGQKGALVSHHSLLTLLPATCIFTPRITFSPSPREQSSSAMCSLSWGDGEKYLLPWRREKTAFGFPLWDYL